MIKRVKDEPICDRICDSESIEVKRQSKFVKEEPSKSRRKLLGKRKIR
jgi:hypothetical protein